MTTFEQIAATFTEDDTDAARLVTIDAVVESESADIDPVLAAKLAAMSNDEFSAYIAERCKDVGLDCPICHENRMDYLVILEDQNQVRCENCGALYEIEATPQKLDYRLELGYDEDSETEAQRVCVEPY